jgi:hypothetical protein
MGKPEISARSIIKVGTCPKPATELFKSGQQARKQTGAVAPACSAPWRTKIIFSPPARQQVGRGRGRPFYRLKRLRGRGDVALDGDVKHRRGIELVGGDVGDAGDVDFATIK